MKNRTYYRSYSQALKRMNLLAGEINRLTENTDEVSMFTLEEQKYTLKLPKSASPTPAPAPAPEAPIAPAPETDSPEMSMDLDSEMGGDDMGGDMDMDTEMDIDTPEGDMEMDTDVSSEPEGEEVNFKMIQKLTGKLGQKIRMMNDAVGMSSEDIKYVINSIMSALDLNKLDDEDKDDIMAKFEEDSDYGMGDEEGDFNISGEDEFDMDTEVDMEEPIEGDMYEEDRDMFDGRPSKVVGVYSNIKKQRMGEMSEEDKATSHISKVMDEIFAESKVDKVLVSYFVINESENKVKQNKLVTEKKERGSIMSNVRQLSETVEQELASEFILKENKNFKFVGKTNKKNLVFEHKGEQIKVSPKGEIL